MSLESAEKSKINCVTFRSRCLIKYIYERVKTPCGERWDENNWVKHENILK